MKKLQISGGIDRLIPTTKNTVKELKAAAESKRMKGEIGKVGRPKRNDKDNENAPSAEKGTKPGEMRKTYLVSKEDADMLDAVAYWDRKTVKEVFAEAMQQYRAGYERKNGKIKPIPKK